jgi:NADPH:quinone reductase-like Zn-dependent oxidoreductase
MKAIRVHEFGGPEVLKLEEVATPKPAAGEVLVARGHLCLEAIAPLHSWI